jgi:hypothetical protein
MREDVTEPESRGWGLDEFLQESEDPFRMSEHFHKWTDADRSYPILCLKFDALWKHLPETFAFLGLPSRTLDDFPEKRDRHSDWTEQPPKIRRRLQEKYGRLADDIEASPEFEII